MGNESLKKHGIGALFHGAGLHHHIMKKCPFRQWKRLLYWVCYWSILV